MLVFLRTIGWMFCAVYATIPLFWLAIHPFAGRWRNSHFPYRAIVPLWCGMWIVAGAVSAPWRQALLDPSLWTWIPAALLFGAGLWLYSRGGRSISLRQLVGVPELLSQHPEQRLVTSGIRARVRHPVYLGHLCEMLAWSVGTGLAVCYGLTAFAIVTGAVMIRFEDRELEQRFGEDFRAYRQKVPALLPRPKWFVTGAL